MSIHPEQATRRSDDNPRRDWPRVITARANVVLDDDPKSRVYEAHMTRIEEAINTALEVVLRDLGHKSKGTMVEVNYGYSAIHVERRTGAYTALPPVIES